MLRRLFTRIFSLETLFPNQFTVLLSPSAEYSQGISKPFLLRNKVLSTKTDKNAEPVEKIVCVDSDSEEGCVDAEPAQPKITSLSEAIEILGDLAEFAERRLQDESLVPSLNKVCSAMQNLRIQNFRQKQISDYFGTTPGVHS